MRSLRLYESKSDPGASGALSSAGSGVAEAGLTSSGELFFTFPTVLSTFHARAEIADRLMMREIG
jgi:hypothetical protein